MDEQSKPPVAIRAEAKVPRPPNQAHPIVALRGGGEVVAFRAMVRKDLAPVVLRFAVEWLWASQGWRFPTDLAHPTAFDAVLELAFAGDPACRYRLPQGAVPEGDEGELVLEAIDPPSWRDDGVCLVWDRRAWSRRCRPPAPIRP